MDIENNLRAMFEHLEEVLSTKTVFGEPIETGETTLIPVLTVTFGLGTGGGTGKAREGDEGGGGGAGVGAKLIPRAIVAITGDQVKVFTIGEKGGWGGLVERVPEVINLLANKLSSRKARLERARKQKDQDNQEQEGEVSL